MKIVAAITLVMLPSTFVFGVTDRKTEERIIRNGSGKTGRCKDVPQETCKRWRETMKDQGCISEWAMKALEKAKGAEGEVGGWPRCTPDLEMYDWCLCGCFHPDTRILVLDANGKQAYVAIREIVKNIHAYRLVVAKSIAFTGRQEITSVAIAEFTQGPEDKELITIDMRDGNRLRVTTQHGVLLSDRRMVVAEELRIGDRLMSDAGTEVEIQNLTRETISEDVINLRALGDSLSSHVIFAEGMMVGDVEWQNDLVPLLNRTHIFDDQTMQ